MKRIYSVPVILLLLTVAAFQSASAQQKEKEQRIKIVIKNEDGSGTVIDTLIRSNTEKDSIILKDGKVICIRESLPCSGREESKCRTIVVTHPESGSDKYAGDKEIIKEITVVSTDSEDQEKTGSKTGTGYHYAISEHGKSHSRYSKPGKTSVDEEITRYVIEKNGITVTVEGSDYNRVREFVKEIEKTFGNTGGKK